MNAFENKWKKGKKYFPSWIEDSENNWITQAKSIIGDKIHLTKDKLEAKLNDWISQEEIQFIKEYLGRIPIGNPYEKIISIFDELSRLQFPSLPNQSGLTSNWEDLFSVWFFERNQSFENSEWIDTSKTIFQNNSNFSKDIVNSVSFSDESNMNCIKYKFFNIYTDENRPNPVEIHFGFTGPDSGKENYYSLVEWYLGSYKININWSKTDDNIYELNGKINNTSSWYSGTRLPKSWQEAIKNTIHLDIENLVNSAPRGETIKRKLHQTIVRYLESIGVYIPSFGGNWNQEFNIQTTWEN